jgi:PAS domain S-box-containing protein
VRKQAEKALKESEEKYWTLLENIEDGYIEVDLAGNAIFFNGSFCKMVGYTRDELKGMNYRKYIEKETVQAVYKTYNKIYTTGVPQRIFDYEIVAKDGTKRIVEVSASLRRNSEGLSTGFRAILRDLTERKRAEQELARHRSHLEAIFRSVNDAIITFDTEGRGIKANRAAESICGLAAEAIVGSAFFMCLKQCNQSCLEALRETLKTKTTIKEFNVECGHLFRPRQMVSITCSPLLDQDGKFMGAVLLIRDITRLRDLERELKERYEFHKIVGKNKKMQEIYGLLEDLADLETTVLVTGESGTGKELVAKALHYSGRRAFKPFVMVNCSALAENLLESELFGHVKGAFTGAIRDKQGRFQIANGGTILLDEIGDISPGIQLKLLRVLQEKEFERVGESKTLKVDVRVIAVTNQDLKEKVRRREFREDLYYRLKVVGITLPPLRERLEDIPLLVDHFCNSFNKSFKKNIEGISIEVLNIFMNYPWPGNIRELDHAMEHGFVLCRGKIISLEHIPIEIRDHFRTGKITPKERASDEPQGILNALNKTDWNKAKASRLLGISRRTIYRKICKYRLAQSSENM